MKKIAMCFTLISVMVSSFAGSASYYYQYENRTALSVGVGYDYYDMEIDEDNYDSFTLSGTTLNLKAETPLKRLSGISIFWDTSIMIPSLATVNRGESDSSSLMDSTFLENAAGTSGGKSSYLLIDNNIGFNMLGNFTDSLFVYLGGGLDIMVSGGKYKYDLQSGSQSYKYGYLGIGVFETIGMYYELTDNIALNLDLSYIKDFAIYNYVNSSENSSSNKFEMIDADGSSYLSKLMVTYNF